MQKLPSLAQSTLQLHSPEQVFFQKMTSKQATNNRYNLHTTLCQLTYSFAILRIIQRASIDVNIANVSTLTVKRLMNAQL